MTQRIFFRSARAHAMSAIPQVALALAGMAGLAGCDDRLPTAAPPADTRPLLAVVPTFTIRDLGTLGGSTATAAGINDAGYVVGRSSIPGDATTEAFLWIPGAQVSSTGIMVSLRTLPGDGASVAYAINGLGEVVGMSRYPADGLPFLWTPSWAGAATGTMQSLGTLGGTGESNAFGINNRGQVVGYSPTPSGRREAFLWSSGSVMQSIGTLPGHTESVAYGINIHGQVVGSSWSPGAGLAFLWTPASLGAFTGTMQSLGTLPGHTYSEAWGINSKGQVVGGSTPGAHQDYHAFLWTAAGGMQDLGTLGGTYSVAFAINDCEQVVGWSTTASGEHHGFFWSAGSGMVDLGTLPGHIGSMATAINSHGQVVGRSDNWPDHRAVLWNVVAPCAVEIDIVPGFSRNVIRIGQRTIRPRLVPVAVLTTSTFDASLVDVATITLGDEAGADTPVGAAAGAPLASLTDVDADGDADLLLGFWIAELVSNGDLTTSTTKLVLVGTLTTGGQVRGENAVLVVP